MGSLSYCFSGSIFLRQAQIRSLCTAVTLLLATGFLLFAFPPGALAIERQYSVQTSTPEGRAVCSFDGGVRNSPVGESINVSVTPASGQEARITVGFSIQNGVHVQLTDAAGVEESCDIFQPDDPSNSVSLLIAENNSLLQAFTGTLDIHAHPNFNCAASDLGQGTLSANLTGPGKLSFFKLRGCDGNQANANLRTLINSPPEVQRGAVLTKDVDIFNHGPGAATSAVGRVRIPSSAFLESFAPSQGVCDFDGKDLACDFGDLPVNSIANLQLNLIPLKVGTLTTEYYVGAVNMGTVFDKETKVKTSIVAGTGAILDLSTKCKNAAGDVAISPDASGGTTTCTCPDPQNPSRDNYRCTVQNYLSQTQVTLTPTLGQFNKFDKACKGQNPCVLDMDPAAAKPDKKTKAIFKP